MAKEIKLYWTVSANKRLDEIREYIISQTYSEAIAEKYIQKLIKRVSQLYDFPNSGQEEPLLKHLNQNSRYLVEGNYKIIYQFNGSEVIITDLFHVKQNPLKIIRRKK